MPDVEAADVSTPAGGGSPRGAGYRRSAGSPRGEARRRELLDRVTADLAVNGLVDFSLRRAARAAGTTHKVLLYHFDGADDLLRQAILQLRVRRIANEFGAATRAPGARTLAARVRAAWPVLLGEAPGRRKLEVAEMILATSRGLLADLRTSDDTARAGAGFEALARALEREEAAGE